MNKLFFISSILLLVNSCNVSLSSSQSSSEEVLIQSVNQNEMMISNIYDRFKENESEKIYKLIADHDDSFAFLNDGQVLLSVYDQHFHVINEDVDEFKIDLKKNSIIYLKVTNLLNLAVEFAIEVKYLNHPIKLPYDISFKEKSINTSYDNSPNLLKECNVNYIKREGGTYIYSNNPEMFTDEDMNQCIMANNHLSGSVYLAFEHANYSNHDAYLGYKLINQSENDVYITIENIGFQAGGTWFGQKAWFDFYNTKFSLPEDYFTNHIISDKYSSFDYGYIDYTPRIYTPTTYNLPKGESFFVIGGSSGVNYNKLNIDHSANQLLKKGQCSNGQVKFSVTNGEVKGKMFIYNQSNKINDNMDEVGYVTIRNGKDYGRQYQGFANHHGVIDNHMSWEFNDLSKPSSLPITYTNSYSYDTSKRKPYEAYENEQHIHHSTNWMTHLNPQSNFKAVGMDMVEFTCNTTDKTQVVIDNFHADGSGESANTANWMIEYQDHFTFINRGQQKRKIILKLKDNGTLATLLRDENGNVLSTYYSVGLANKEYSEYYLEIEPQSSLKVVLDYLLVACSYGSVTHEVSLK